MQLMGNMDNTIKECISKSRVREESMPLIAGIIALRLSLFEIS